jgi:hypothetical protein
MEKVTTRAGVGACVELGVKTGRINGKEEALLRHSFASISFASLRMSVTFSVIITGSFGNPTLLGRAVLRAERKQPCVQFFIKVHTFKFNTRH